MEGQLAKASPSPDWGHWAHVVGRVCERLRLLGQPALALELGRVGGGLTRRLRAELALANLAVGHTEIGCAQLAAEPLLEQRLAPVVEALCGGTIKLSSAPKLESVRRLASAAKTVREAATKKWSSARRAAKETGSEWFMHVLEQSYQINTKGRALEGPVLALRQGSNAAVHDTLCCAAFEDALQHDPLSVFELVSLRQAVSKDVLRYWFARKFQALAADRPALTRWLRTVEPEQLPRALHADLYLQRAFSHAADGRARATADLNLAKQLGADPVEIARAALLIEHASGQSVFSLSQAADYLAAALLEAGAATEAAVVTVSVWAMAGAAAYEGVPHAWLMQRLELSRQATTKLGEDEALANYELDCLEATIVHKLEPERARQLAERATQDHPKFSLGWLALLACVRSASTDEAKVSALLEQAFAATGSAEFHPKLQATPSSSAAPLSFETLVWRTATASDLMRAAIAHLRQNFGTSLTVEPRAWFACWAQVLPHRSECEALALAGFDAGTLAYALGAFHTSECAGLLNQLCSAGAHGTPSARALWVLFAPESELAASRALQLCTLAVRDFTAPPELSAKSHPLSVLVSALVTFGRLPDARRLLSQSAASVELSVLRAAKAALDTQGPEHGVCDWGRLHDALHPAACLHALLAGELDSGDSDPELEKLKPSPKGGEEGELDALTHEELIEDFLAEVSSLAKLLRLDAEKFRALVPARQIALIDAFDAIHPADADAVARTRRLANDFGVARTTEAPKLNLPKSTQDKNRRKRERRERKGQK